MAADSASGWRDVAKKETVEPLASFLRRYYDRSGDKYRFFPRGWWYLRCSGNGCKKRTWPTVAPRKRKFGFEAQKELREEVFPIGLREPRFSEGRVTGLHRDMATECIFHSTLTITTTISSHLR